MAAIVSIRPANDRFSGLANRLLCAARLTQAQSQLGDMDRGRRAIEILETAPENRLLSPAFDQVYLELVPLYFKGSFFERSVEHPDFDQRQLETFRTAFERFTLLTGRPASRTVKFYLGVIDLAYGRIEEARQRFAGARGVWGISTPALLAKLGQGNIQSAEKDLEPYFSKIKQATEPIESKQPEVEEFLKYCGRHKDNNARGKQRNQIIFRWLSDEIAAPRIGLSYPVIKHFATLLKEVQRKPVFLRGIETDEDEVVARAADKRGVKIISFYDPAERDFIGKYEIVQGPDDLYGSVPLTPNTAQMTHARSNLILDWYERGQAPPDCYFMFPMEFDGKLRLLGKDGNRCEVHGLKPFPLKEEEIRGYEEYFAVGEKPGENFFIEHLKAEQIRATEDDKLIALWEKSHLVAIRFYDRGGQKIFGVFGAEDLSSPVAKYRLLKNPKGQYKTEPLILNPQQIILRRNENVRAWQKGLIEDPRETSEFEVSETGVLVLCRSGGKQTSITGLSEYFLGIPFEKKEILGLEKWFYKKGFKPACYYFKPGATHRRIVEAENDLLSALWNRASKVRVRCATIEGEKIVTIFQKNNPSTARRFKLIVQSNDTVTVEAVDPSPQQMVRRIQARIRAYFIGSGPRPLEPVALPVRSNGSIDLIITGSAEDGIKLTLFGLAECLKLKGRHRRRAAALFQKYPKFFIKQKSTINFGTNIRA